MKASVICMDLALVLGLAGIGCHVDQETDTSAGFEVSQVIKFENVTDNIPVLVRIPDANQEFELGVGESRTVPVHGGEGITTFFVQIFQNRPQDDISTAPRWTGFVEIGKVVTIRQRITIQPEVHD